MSDELTDAQLAELHADLIAVRETVGETVRAAQARSETVELDQATVGRLSRVDAMQQQQMAAAQLRQLELRLKQVATALTTHAEGEYGWCKVCGEPIGYRRLKARPESPACVGCMARLERSW